MARFGLISCAAYCADAAHMVRLKSIIKEILRIALPPYVSGPARVAGRVRVLLPHAVADVKALRGLAFVPEMPYGLVVPDIDMGLGHA